MYIIDKNKDYYDYISTIYGIDKNTTFDRRGSTVIDDKFLAQSVDLLKYDRNSFPFYYKYRKRDNFLGDLLLLEIGTIQYIIEFTKVKHTTDEYGVHKYLSSKMILFREFHEGNLFGSPLSIRDIHPHWQWRINFRELVKSHSFKEAINIQRGSEWFLNLPILANTQIPSLIKPDVIWKELSTYISSLKNDIDVSLPMTEEEKAEIHGFDRKTSFRHPIKLS